LIEMKFSRVGMTDSCLNFPTKWSNDSCVSTDFVMKTSLNVDRSMMPSRTSLNFDAFSTTRRTVNQMKN
jgi:hypothetical protein